MPRAELLSRIHVSLASSHLIPFQKRQMLHDKKVYRNAKSKGISNKDVAEALRWFIQECSDWCLVHTMQSIESPQLKWLSIYLLSVPQPQLELISLSLIPNQCYRQDYRCIDLMTVKPGKSKSQRWKYVQYLQFDLISPLPGEKGCNELWGRHANGAALD